MCTGKDSISDWKMFRSMSYKLCHRSSLFVKYKYVTSISFPSTIVCIGTRSRSCCWAFFTWSLVYSAVSCINSILIGQQNRGHEDRGFFQIIISFFVDVLIEIIWSGTRDMKNILVSFLLPSVSSSNFCLKLLWLEVPSHPHLQINVKWRTSSSDKLFITSFIVNRIRWTVWSNKACNFTSALQSEIIISTALG